MKLGREVVRMIRDLQQVSQGETGYVRRHFTFPGGSVHMLLANDSELADRMEKTASVHYDVTTAIPPSTLD